MKKILISLTTKIVSFSLWISLWQDEGRKELIDFLVEKSKLSQWAVLSFLSKWMVEYSFANGPEWDDKIMLNILDHKKVGTSTKELILIMSIEDIIKKAAALNN